MYAAQHFFAAIILTVFTLNNAVSVPAMIKCDKVYQSESLDCGGPDTHCIYTTGDVLITGAEDGLVTLCAEVKCGRGKKACQFPADATTYAYCADRKTDVVKVEFNATSSRFETSGSITGQWGSLKAKNWQSHDQKTDKAGDDLYITC